MATAQEIQFNIKDVISQDKVVVFSKSYCPYCKLAKEVSTYHSSDFFLNFSIKFMTHMLPNIRFYLCIDLFKCKVPTAPSFY